MTKAEVEKVAKKMFKYYYKRRKHCVAFDGYSFEYIYSLLDVDFRDLARWHLRQMAKARAETFDATVSDINGNEIPNSYRKARKKSTSKVMPACGGCGKRGGR